MIYDANTLRDVELETDIVIIGSGAGGSVAAYELTKAGFRVILIEEGKKYTSEDIQRNTWEAVKKTYRDIGMISTLGKPPIPIPLGKALGGTTLINSGTCFRTPKDIVEKWNRDFNLSINYTELEPHFDFVETMISVQEVPYELMGNNNLLFKKGADKLNFHGFPLKRNAKFCKGAGLCVFVCPNDAKQSVNLNFIPSAIKNGLMVITSLKAEKILLKNNQAIGIKGSVVEDNSIINHKNQKNQKKKNIFIKAKKVILACGAISTPLLLLKNRLSNSSKQVGKNLFIHPAAKILALFEEDIHSWNGVPQAYCVDEFFNEGIMFEGFFLPPSFLSIAIPSFGNKLRSLMKQYSKLAGFGVMVSDTSKGRIFNFKDIPIILYNLNKEDFKKFIKGIRIASQIFFEAGAKEVFLPIHNPKLENIKEKKDLDLLEKETISPSDLELIAFHPMGSCRMGSHPRNSVVNQNLESHDVKNLYIVDASIFPSSLGVNPQISIMAFSRYASHKIINNS